MLRLTAPGLSIGVATILSASAQQPAVPIGADDIAGVVTGAPFHMEGGKANTSKAIHFQLRPDPLAR